MKHVQTVNITMQQLLPPSFFTFLCKNLHHWGKQFPDTTTMCLFLFKTQDSWLVMIPQVSVVIAEKSLM